MTAIRRPGAASAAVLIVLSTGLVAAHLIAPEWVRRAGLDVWNIGAAETAHRTAAERRCELEAYEEACARRREAANHFADQLVAGATALPTATDQVRAIFADDTGVLVSLESLYPGAPTERLRFARHVIDRATRDMPADAPRCAEVRARLEAEYRAMAAEHDSPPAP